MDKVALGIVGGGLVGIILGIGVTVALLPNPSEIAPVERPSSAGRGESSRSSAPATNYRESSPAGMVTGSGPKADAPADVTTAQGLVTALRRAGASEMQIADFIAAQAGAQRRERQRELAAKIARGEADPDSRAALFYGANVERDQLIRTALGEEAFRQWDKQNYVDRVMRVNLSAEEFDSWYALQKEHETRTLEISQRLMAGEIDQADNTEQMRLALKEQEQRLRDLLGPDRHAQYYAANFGDTSGSVRWALRDLGLNENQFSQLSRADVQLAQFNAEMMERQRTGVKSDTYARDMQAAQAARDAEYQRVLGTQGWLEYQKQQDYQYKQMIKFAAAWQLSKADADYVYDVQRQYRQAVSTAQKSGASYDYRTVGQQAAQTLQTYLGNERYDKLRKASVINLPVP